MSARSLVSTLLGLLLALLAGAPCASAQPARPAATEKAGKTAAARLPAKLAARLAETDATLAEVAKTLRDLPGADLADLRTKVETAQADAAHTAERLQPRLEAIRLQIEKLGPAPGNDAPAEPPAVAAQRTKLMGLAAAYDGAIRTSEVARVRAEQLIERIARRRHAQFTRNLTQRVPSPLTPGAWRQLRASAESVGRQLAGSAADWWSAARPKSAALGLALVTAVTLFALLKLILAGATRWPAQPPELPPPTFFARAVAAFRVAAFRVLPVAIAAAILYIGLDALGLLESNPWGRLLPALLEGVLAFAIILALVRAALSPVERRWRLVQLDDRAARRLIWLLGGMAAVYALDGVVSEASRVFHVPLALSVAQSTVSSLAFASLLMGVLLTPFAPQCPDTEEPADGRPRDRSAWLKLPLWGLAVGIVAAALLGYTALARFASQQLVLTGMVALVGWLGYLAIRAFTREPSEQSRALAHVLEHRFGLEAPRRRQLARLTELALTFALALLALPFLLLQWGFSAADIRDWSASLLFGFQVGQFRISLVRILVGIVLFIALLFAIRVLQRWLRDTLLQPHMDAGVANSVEAVAGYALTALAALFAISYAGFDITSLAIVAGALSLGIGFGLQSIVNNFVSGLILLIERPIKVGDRLIVGDQQGHVRRISVRATEIETFDRVSLIIPNSELISGRVMNWTHRNPLSAFGIRVGVSYNADPEQVIGILLKCAEDHPQVLREPPPMAVLEDFGDSALLFTLRVTLLDVATSYSVTSDLRVAIFKALRAAAIEIPFNQIDVNLRDLETLRRCLDEVVERSHKGKGTR